MSSTTPPPDFGLFTSLRYDPQLRHEPENTKLSHYDDAQSPTPFYSLRFHYERLITALDHFGWTINAVPALANLDAYRGALEAAVQSYQERSTSADKATQSLKLRPVVWHDGRLDIDVTPTPPVPLDNLFLKGPIPPPEELQPPLFKVDYAVFIDSQPTKPSSYTSHKTTPRPHYDAARLRVGIRDDNEPKEVMIWNPEGNVMEGSRTNVYLYRDGQWVTPTDASGCLHGTERRWLHEQGLVTLQDVHINDVKDMETVLLSNGLRGTWGATSPGNMLPRGADTVSGWTEARVLAPAHPWVPSRDDAPSTDSPLVYDMCTCVNDSLSTPTRTSGKTVIPTLIGTEGCLEDAPSGLLHCPADGNPNAYPDQYPWVSPESWTRA